jgi:CheY-like chemotaxis protein/HPt (histidine-containing phosphotransfer) domain-containing protein
MAVDSGVKALRAIEEAAAADTPYGLVLLDWRMPGMDGIEVARRIRGHARLIPKPHIIMITAHGREDFFQQVRELQLDGTLLKPVSPSSLFEAIAGAMSGDSLKGEAAASIPRSYVPLAAGRDLPSVRGAQVLLAEDNLINQQIAQEILEQAGVLVTVADNGRIAIDKLRSGHFDLVLMDVQMPEMDGYQATATIRSDPHFEDFPIIAMTAHAMSGDRDRCLAAGMNDYVTKPIDPALLIRTIARCLGREPTPPQGAPEAGPSELPGKVQSVELPDALEGVNVGEGLRRLGGNRKLYLRLLRDFATAQAKLPEQIRDAVNARDFATALHQVHSLKGAAANLAIAQVATCAGELETVLNVHHLLQFQTKFPELEAALAIVLESLDQLTAPLETVCSSNRTTPPMSPAPEQALNRDTAREVLARLRQQVASGDLEAADTLRNLGENCGTHFREELKVLRQHLDGFNFDEASQVLETLEARLREI